MNSIPPAQRGSALLQGSGSAANPHGAATHAVDRRTSEQAPSAEAMLHDADDAALFTTTRHGSATPGIAALLTMLRELRPELHTLLPPRTAQLLAALQQQVIGVANLGDYRQLRQQLLRSPDPAAATLAAADAAVASAPAEPDGAADQDPGTLLLQLLQSLQSGRRVVVNNGSISFAAAHPVTAYCLQAYAEEQSAGSPWKRLRALLLSNAEAAVQNLFGAQTAGVNRNTGKIPQRTMQLLLQHGEQTLAVPLTLSWHATAAPEIWEAEFDLDLAEAGTLHVVLAVKNTSVSVSLLASREAFGALLEDRRHRLAYGLGNQGLTLATFSVAGTAHDS